MLMTKISANLKLTRLMNSGPEHSDTACVMESCVFPHFLKLHSLYIAKAFMYAKLEFKVQSQINNLYRIRDICKVNKVSNILDMDTTKKYGLSLDAISGHDRFLNYMSSSKWPS